nr:phosphotransferase [Acaryochloris sp. IP29b_bin.137]
MSQAKFYSNLLVHQQRLHAVIDFGCLGVGDPACDYAIAWTFFSGESRTAFQSALAVDDATWARSRGWALWKSLITLVEALDKKASTTVPQATINQLIDNYYRDT